LARRQLEPKSGLFNPKEDTLRAKKHYFKLIFLLMFFIFADKSMGDITDQLSFSTSDFDTATGMAPDSNYYTTIFCKLIQQDLADTAGDPWLSSVNYVYSLPEGQEIDYVSINSKDTTLLTELTYAVFPRQEPMPTCIDCEPPDFTPPNSSYQLDKFPAESDLATCVLPISFSFGMGLGTIKIRPVIYDIADEELWLITNISITIHLKTASREPVTASERSIVADKTINRFLKGMVENPGDVDDNTPTINVYSYNYPVNPDSVPIEYMIITTGDYAAELEPLKRWKTFKGYKAEIVVIEDNIYPYYQGVDDAEKLRNFLIDYKTNHVEFCYAVLAGDIDDVPIRYTVCYDGTSDPPLVDKYICDLYFADIDGNWNTDEDGRWGEPWHDDPDFGAEIYVARLPLQLDGNATTWIEKLIRYEVEPGYGNYQYLSNAMISSADQMADTISDTGEEWDNQPALIAECFSNFFDVNTEDFREYPSGHDPYPTSPWAADIIDFLSTPSVGYYISLGHGSPHYYRVLAGCYNLVNCLPDAYSSEITAFPSAGFIELVENQGREYIHSSIACATGAIDVESRPWPWVLYDTSFVERDLFVDGGSVSGTYNTREGLVFYSYFVEMTRISQLMNFNRTENRFGLAHFRTKTVHSIRFAYSNNYFGDPEFQVYTDYPGSFIVDFPATAKMDSIQPVTIRVRDSYYGTGVPDVLVTLFKDHEIYERGFTNATGYVSLTLYPQSLGYTSILCSKSQFIPFQDSILTFYCAEAVAGDVNSNGYVTGSDVTYASNYFKGGPPPPDSCMCPDDFLYHAADANGSCEFIGSDVTYLLNYFRGGPAPVFCQACPNAGMLDLNQKVIPTETAKREVNSK
jgi:hypothetical protein